MLIAIQQRNSNSIGTQKCISRSGLESHLQPFWVGIMLDFFLQMKGICYIQHELSAPNYFILMEV